MSLVDASDLRLYSARQLAVEFDCSVRHIYELISEGELATVDISLGSRSKMRVPASSARALIQRRAGEPG